MATTDTEHGDEFFGGRGNRRDAQRKKPVGDPDNWCARLRADTPVRLRSTPYTDPVLSDSRCFESDFFAGFQKCSRRYGNSDGKKTITQAT
jgi:hypothetical protein